MMKLDEIRSDPQIMEKLTKDEIRGPTGEVGEADEIFGNHF